MGDSSGCFLQHLAGGMCLCLLLSVATEQVN